MSAVRKEGELCELESQKEIRDLEEKKPSKKRERKNLKKITSTEVV